jgi:S-adenosyl methyltransferase
MDAVPSGSYLAISHVASGIRSDAVARAARAYNASSVTAVTARPRAAVARFFDGLELVPPGVVPLGQWTPGDVAGHDVGRSGDKALTVWVGLARKP